MSHAEIKLLGPWCFHIFPILKAAEMTKTLAVMGCGVVPGSIMQNSTFKGEQTWQRQLLNIYKYCFAKVS